MKPPAAPTGRRKPAASATPSGPSRRWVGTVVAGVAVVGAALAWWRGGAPSGGPSGGAIGGVTGCQTLPRFAQALGVGPKAAFGTSVQGVKGLAVFDPDATASGRSPVYQHETWDDAGYLGPFVYDRRGDIYVAPVPLVSLEDNPPARQNTLYRVDSADQTMAKFVDLPPAQPPSGANPFGVIGLAYDCDTESVYASSVAGSTAAQENGRIFRIDLRTRAVLPVLTDRDPFGLAVFHGTAGKRLYFGLARQPELYSVALDDQGDTAGEPRFELSLAALPDGTQDKIRRIRFLPGPTMTLQAYDFTYSLQVASERKERVFDFGYDGAKDAWSPRGDGRNGP